MIGVLIAACPIFLAFVFSGFSMFHENTEMDTTSKVMISLVAMIAGDETLNTMRKTAFIFGFRGYVFTYAFSFVFFLMIKNVVIFLFTSTFMKQLKETKKAKLEKKRRIKNTPKKQRNKNFTEKVKLHRGNMMTTRMLRTSDKELAKDRFKARTKYMFEANMKKVKSEIERSVKDKKSIDFLEVKNLAEHVNVSIIEMESTIGDIHDNSIYLGEYSKILKIDFKA